ncbi:MAG: hypothetical protein IBX55_18285 [Methyloprofundus sp.]|nr:hypothetical protein [Methyloprofundus sp.]
MKNALNLLKNPERPHPNYNIDECSDRANCISLSKTITSENLAITLKALVDGKPSSKQLEAMTATAYAPNLIHELNRRGWNISNEKREGKNRKGRLVKYGVYVLDPGQLGDALDALICYKQSKPGKV